ETWCWAGYRSPRLPFQSGLLSTFANASLEKTRGAFCTKAAVCARPQRESAVRGCRLVFPAALAQQLEGPIAVLVVHLAAALYPVAEVHVGQAQCSGPLDLPENGEAAEAAAFLVRIEKGVDGREP